MRNPNDERAVKSRRRLLDATQALMVERGVEAVTILAVAQRSGLQRSTVYNHWPDRLSLLIDAIGDFAAPEPPPAADDDDRSARPVERIRSATLGLARNLGADWGAIAASLAAAAERDEALARAHQAFVQSRRAEVAALVAEATAAGEIGPGFDPQWVTTLLVGPLYYERLVMHRPMTEAEAVDHIDRVLALISRPS